MNVGETTYISVRADKLWNDSGILVIPSQTYNFVVPENEKCIDWHIPCGADGYPSTPLLRPWEELQCVPDANGFELIGAVGGSTKPPIVIGSRLFNFSAPLRSLGRRYRNREDERVTNKCRARRKIRLQLRTFVEFL